MRTVWLAAAIGAGVLAVACDAPRHQGGSPDELTIVVQADRRELEAQETLLKSREAAMKNEAGELDKRIKELASSRTAADLEHRRRLDDELSRAKAAQEELSRRVQVLQQQKISMEVQRSALDGHSSSAGLSSTAVRDAMVAARESRLSNREGSLAAREADLAGREKALLAREARAATERTEASKAVPAVAIEAAKAVPASLRNVPPRESVEGRHKKLLAEMDGRGILVSDLAAEDQPLNAEIHGARRNGDWSHAADLLGDLSRAMARLRVDQRFVEAKMVRLQGQRATARLGDGQRGEVEALLRDVTSSYSDGQYDKANRGLNRIAAILDASKASG